MNRQEYRAIIEPHLVNLIAGLRLNQVEEAMRILLDYVDASSDQPSSSKRPASEQSALEAIQRALADYHFALDLRKHGGDACQSLATAIKEARLSPWRPSEELRRRTESHHREHPKAT